jgi:hypothetical protein
LGRLSLRVSFVVTTESVCSSPSEGLVALGLQAVRAVGASDRVQRRRSDVVGGVIRDRDSGCHDLGGRSKEAKGSKGELHGERLRRMEEWMGEVVWQV